MGLYTRRQLILLLILLAIAGAGWAVGAWRRAWPETAERLEQIDRERAAPAPRPQSAESRPALEPLALPLDVNRATAGELARLPGIGPGLAARIVETREARGPFASPDDLRRVPGLGRSRLARIRAAIAITP
ncbi:MAG: helix-hairpin-helix domain-containing protein [Candidatus Rokubacteria bacterium]|nr:helix-hairpin-helix domain-containing protein [Candidatus Rokubacteria bacterium]